MFVTLGRLEKILDKEKRLAVFHSSYGHGNITAEILFNHKNPEMGDYALLFSLDTAGYTRAYAIITPRNINYPHTLQEIRIYYKDFEIKMNDNSIDIFCVDPFNEEDESEEGITESQEDENENSEGESSNDDSAGDSSNENSSEEDSSSSQSQSTTQSDEWVEVESDTSTSNNQGGGEEENLDSLPSYSLGNFRRYAEERVYNIFSGMNLPFKVPPDNLRDRSKYSTYITLNEKEIKIGRNSKDRPYSTITIDKSKILIEKFSDIYLEPDNCGIEENNQSEGEQSGNTQNDNAAGNNQDNNTENSNRENSPPEPKPTNLRSLVEINRDRVTVKKIEKVESEDSEAYYARTHLDITDNDIYIARNYIKDGALQMKTNMTMDCQTVVFSMYDQDEKLRARTRVEEEKTHISLYNKDENVVSSVILKPDSVQIVNTDGNEVKSSIVINNQEAKTISNEVKVHSKNKSKITSGGEIELEGQKITIKGAPDMSAASNTEGGFCAITVCPVTGLPHLTKSLIAAPVNVNQIDINEVKADTN